MAIQAFRAFQKTRYFRGLIILLLAIGFTAFSVHTSMQKGRLSNIPNYDDVTYFASATDLVQSVRQDGWRGLAAFMSRDSLHSPYSISLAALAYAIGGYHDVAPYAANGVLIVVYLSCIAYFFRSCRLLPFLL